MGKQRYFDDISDVDLYKNLGVEDPFHKSAKVGDVQSEDLTKIDLFKNLGISRPSSKKTQVKVDSGDYDYRGAFEKGITPDETGHWPSMNGEGKWLKNPQTHPTAWKEAYYQVYGHDPAKDNISSLDQLSQVDQYRVKELLKSAQFSPTILMPGKEKEYQDWISQYGPKGKKKTPVLTTDEEDQLPANFFDSRPFVIKDLPADSESTSQPQPRVQDVLSFEDLKKQTEQEDARNKLIKGVQQYQEGKTIFGIPKSVERQVEIIQHPEKMTPDEADAYYKDQAKQSIGVNIAGEKVTPQKLMAGAYKFIPSFLKNYIEPVLRDYYPEQYRFLKADQVRQVQEITDPENIKDFMPELYNELKKSGKLAEMKEKYDQFKTQQTLEGYTNFGANMVGELAGLFAFAGPIHEGYNTMGVIGRLAETNPRIATAISSFLAGGTYSGLGSAPKVATGEQSVQSAGAEAIATGITFAAFSQVGTKDWLNSTKYGEPRFTYKDGKFESAKLVAKTGHEKEYLTRSIANWLIDTGGVTGISDVAGKVAQAVELSDKKGIPITEAVGETFKIDPAKLGIEFLINGLFTGGIPRQYQRPPKTAGFERRVGGGEKPLTPEQTNYLQIPPKTETPPPVETTTPRPPVKTYPQEGFVPPAAAPPEKIPAGEFKPQEFEPSAVEGLTNEDLVNLAKLPVDQRHQAALDKLEEKKKRAEGIKQRTEKNKAIQQRTEEEQRIEAARKEKEDKKLADLEYNDLNKARRQVRKAKQTGDLIDESSFKDFSFTHPKVQSAAEELYNDVLQHNKKLRDANKITPENIAKRKYKTSDLNSLNPQQQSDVLLTYNNYRLEGKTEFDQLKSTKLSEVENATRLRQVRGGKRESNNQEPTGREVYPPVQGEGRPLAPGRSEGETGQPGGKGGGEKEIGDVAESLGHKKVSEDYYIHKRGMQGKPNFYEKVTGEKVALSLPGDFFIHTGEHKGDKWYSVSEGLTGLNLVDADTKEEAIQKANEMLNKYDSDKFNELVKSYVDKSGPSPRYKKLNAERSDIELNPTEAQIEAGNAKKLHYRKEGFEISVENTKGSVRSGTDEKGKAWSTEMKQDYGYLKGTVGYDKDHLDVFVNPNYIENSPAYIVNQTKPDGSFDEHKVMFGYDNKKDALKAYLSNYEKGWKNYSDIVEMPMDEFKEWSRNKKEVAKGPVEEPPKEIATGFTPKDKWQDNLIKAREYARALHIEFTGMDLETLVRNIAARLKADYPDQYKKYFGETTVNVKTNEFGNWDIVEKYRDGKKVWDVKIRNILGREEFDDLHQRLKGLGVPGGHWSAAEKAFVFNENPIEAIKKEFPSGNVPETKAPGRGGNAQPPSTGKSDKIDKDMDQMIRDLEEGLGDIDFKLKSPYGKIRKMVQSTGLIFNGIQDFKDKTFAVWTDPGTGSTHYTDSDGLTPEKLISERDRYRKAFGKVQTFTPEFKKWFGKSVVVGKNGQPLIVYHGTPYTFESFDPKESLYFAENPEYANYFAEYNAHQDNPAQVLPVFLKIEKPFDLTKLGYGDYTDEEITKILNDKGIEMVIHTQGAPPVPVWRYLRYHVLQQKIKDAGYDGVIFYETNFDEPGTEKSQSTKAFLVYKPAQVKSAIGNKGTFDVKDTRIVFQLKPGQKIPAKVQTIANELVGKFVEKEVYKFEDILGEVRKAYGEETLRKIFPALKAGYTAHITNAPDEELAKMDTFDFVRQYQYGQVESILPDTRKFIQRVREEMGNGNQMNKTQLEKLAREYGITDQNFAKELAETAVVLEAHRYATQLDDEAAFEKIVELYENQPNLTHRTSESVKNQQYSTPAPIAFVASSYVADKVGNGDVLEPSAGTGMLAIAFDPSQVSVNEIDPVRNKILNDWGFEAVKNLDAAANDNLFNKKFDGIVTNPPFGSADTKLFDGYKLNKLEHIMAANALKQMKDDGRAAIIIGGHNVYDNKGRLKSDRTFFNWLYNHYNVDAVLNLNGDLYTKQGTKFPIRLILVNGRKANPEGAAPLFDADKNGIVNSFEDLYNITKEIRNESILRPQTDAGRGNGTNVNVPGSGPVQTGVEAATSPVPEGETGKPDNGGRGATGQTPGMGGGRPPTTKPGSGITGRPGGGTSGLSPISTPVPSGQFGSAGGGVESEGPRGDLSQNEYQDVDNVTGKSILENEKPNIPYSPKSKAPVLDTVIPKNMAYDTAQTLEKIAQDVGGDIDEFVRGRLGYESKEEMFSRLGAEQVDAVAMAIVSIEKGQGMIVGDMAGIGKGRVAAAVIRYANINGKKAVFFTEKAKLFSDLYRDLKNIGSADLVPFIVNSYNSVQPPDIVDEDGNVIYKAMPRERQVKFFQSGDLSGYDFIVSTYHQVNSDQRPLKRSFVARMSEGNIVILDESHNASGESATSEYIKELVASARGVTFLSATFAKRPNNMPVYALKTAISEANLSMDDLINAIEKGGVALQEVLSTDLVEAGQMIRRERTFEGIEVKYTPLTHLRDQHAKTADAVTEILRDIIKFQIDFVNPVVGDLDTDAAGEGGMVGIETGTNKAGVDNQPFVSKVFNVIDQLLFSLKADATAEEAIKLLKANKKPVIAVKNTMETFLTYMGVAPEDIIENTDFAAVLERGLKGVMRITIKDAEGNRTPSEITVNDLTPEGRKEYKRILDKINSTSSGITISPIDRILYLIEKAGYKMGELTGRNYKLIFREDGKAIVKKRSEKNVNTILYKFNNCDVGGNRNDPTYGYDGLILNSAAASGNSGHASVDFVDQRVRAMIITQIELNINTEIQKRFRINRTGQVVLPEYNTLSTAIPAEQRLLMIARKKLRSLDANVSSDQQVATETIQANDFINKYGDRLVIEYLKENREMNDLMMDPMDLNGMDNEEIEKFTFKEGAANKVTGRVAILPTNLQEEFYTEMEHRYNDYIDYLNSVGENDLELQALPLDAVTTQSRVLVVGKGGDSPFGRDSVIETAEVNVLKKPWKMERIKEVGTKYLEGMNPTERKDKIVKEFREFWKSWKSNHIERAKSILAKHYSISVEDISTILEVKVNGRVNDAMTMKYLQEKYPHLTDNKIFQMIIDLNKYLDVNEDYDRKENYIAENIFGRFDVGRVYRVPVTRGEYPTFTNGIFLGWYVNLSRKNPYAPSAITLKFAVADSRQLVSLPGSQRDWLNEINGESASLSQWQRKDILSEWDSQLPQNRRELRQVVTGNVLQAMGKDTKGGKLITYTTKDGGLKRGILLSPDANLKIDEVRVPIKRAKGYIKKLAIGDFVETANGNVTIMRDRGGKWEIEVPASKAKGGKYYLDDKLSTFMITKRFDKFGDKMRAYFTDSNFDKVIDYLQDDFGESVRLSQDQMRNLGDNGIAYSLKPVKIQKDSNGRQMPAIFSKPHQFLQDHPYTEDVKVYVSDFKTVYWIREQIEDAGYPIDFFTDSEILPGEFGYEKGKTRYAVKIEGYEASHSKTGEIFINLSSTADSSTYPEEILHTIQDRLPKENPELHERIKNWEQAVSKAAKDYGLSIPGGDELFVQSILYNHLNWAADRPDVAELLWIPDDIVKDFITELDKSSSGKLNNSSLLTGFNKPRAIRLPGEPAAGGQDVYNPNNPDISYSLKPGKTKQDLLGKNLDSEKARNEGRTPTDRERLDGNIVDYGVGLGQIFSMTGDKLFGMINDVRLRKEYGLDKDPALERIYRELLTAPVWFFDKEPQLHKIWDIIDRHYVRNVNEETATLLEDMWKQGKNWRKLSDLEQKEYLSALKDYENIQYTLQRDGEPLELLPWADFADEYNLTPKVKEWFLGDYRRTIEQALDYVKDVDRYKVIYDTPDNPYLEEYNASKKKAEDKVNLLEEAKDEFFGDDPNAQASYENELLKQGTKIDEVKALNDAWKNNENLRANIAEIIVEKKYAGIDGKTYFPSSRLNHKYFLSAVKKTTPEEKLLEGKFDDHFFATDDSLTNLDRLKKELESHGWEVKKPGMFKDAQEGILQNAVTQEDILDLAISAGVEHDNPVLERLVKAVIAKGFSRHFIAKKFIPGFRYDPQNFETAIYRYINSVPYYKNRTIGHRELEKTMARLKNEGILEPNSNDDRYLQELNEKINNRDNAVSRALRMVASVYYLAFRPAYLIQQVVQPFNTLLPLLPMIAKELKLKAIDAEKAFGESFVNVLHSWSWKVYDKANRMLGRKSKSTFGLADEWINVLRRLERQGVAKPLRSMEIVGSEVDPKKYYKFNPGVNIATKIFRWIGIPGILVEDFTRVMGIRAFYTLGKKAGLKGEPLLDFISESIAKSYGPASGRLSKPPGYKVPGRNIVSKTLQTVINSYLTFLNFAFMNYGQWGKSYRFINGSKSIRGLLYKLFAQLALGGLKYIMWSTTILTLMGLVYDIFDVPEDPREQYLDIFKHLDKLYPGLGDAFYRGFASATFKIDLSALFSQQAPFPTEELEFGKTTGEIAGGAPISAAEDIYAGRPPSGIKNLSTAERYQEEGVKLGNRKLIPSVRQYEMMSKSEKRRSEPPITDEEKFKKKLGFTPLRVSKAYEEEKSRQVKSAQLTDIIQKYVSDEVIPLIEAKKYRDAGKKIDELYKKYQDRTDILTERQGEKVKRSTDFLNQIIIPRLQGEDRQIILDWKSGTIRRTGSKLRDLGRKASREITR